LTGTPLRILLVDDDPGARDLARALLVAAGHEVEAAEDGRAGLEAALKRAPDLIVTDVLMPQLDGWTLARTLRAHPSLSLVPIVFLTALDSPDHALEGFAIGADDYLPKSSALAGLLPAVDRVMARRRELRSFVDRRLTPEAAFKGTLEKLRLPAVLSLLESVAKSGTLRLTSPRGRAILFVRRGTVIGAELVDTEALRDAHLVYHLATWTQGEFEFVDGPVSGDDAIRKSTTELLLEAARRQDERPARSGDLPGA